MKIDEYRRGYRDGVGFAVKWLYAEARRMNDPNAKAVLNLAADRDWQCYRRRTPRRSRYRS